MDLDRQIMMAVGAAVFAMLIVGVTMLTPSSSGPVDTSSRPPYSKDDIRYPYQQAELKEAKKHPKKPGAKPQPEQFVTDGSTTSGGSGGDDGSSGDDPNEEPSVTDHEPQEEPPNDGE